MRRVVLGLALMIAGSSLPASAQSFWPFDLFESKRATPRSRPASTAPPVRRTAPPKAPLSEDAGDLQPQQSGAVLPWRISRAAWTDADEKAFEDFVARIGESGCRTVHACLTGAEANPMFRASNPAGMHFFADCADLPYMLRAYFAWKSNLPFSYSSAVTPIGATRDIRYTTAGNRITARRDIKGPAVDARRAIQQIIDAISSAHYRYPPAQLAAMLPDHYPVRISRQSIKPGTIIYDPNGHVAVVYKVGADGRIHYIDSHPDNSLTRGVYGKAFSRSSPGMGAGFKRWRPLTLAGATTGADGHLEGGTIRLAPDAELADWSDEQFYGTGPSRPATWSAGRFVFNGETLDYYEYVRKRLADAGFKYNPLDETRGMVRALCEDARYRVDAVDIAIKAGLHQRPQPARLPLNIYGTEGDWETYSTPSRDARLKTAFKELRDEIARFLKLATDDPSKLDYSGGDLRGDLRRVYLEEAATCTIVYRKGDGTPVELGFQELGKRLFRLSFDPHHCIERRWGAVNAEELAGCADDADKLAWYEAQQRLRNQISRPYDTRMGFGLARSLPMCAPLDYR
jgi:hypothetical protein